MRTSELTGAALDWAVAKCEGEEVQLVKGQLETCWTANGWKPSTDWAQGGPILEREIGYIEKDDRGWQAVKHNVGRDYFTIGPGGASSGFGPTPLIAAMRCYVASKLGKEVELPEDLI